MNTEEKSIRQCWRTPPDLWGQIVEIWNPTFDLAANAENRLCESWCGPGSVHENAFDISYSRPGETAYCNPGFSGMLPWVDLCDELIMFGAFREIVLMGMVAPSTEWYGVAAESAKEIIMLSPRVQFLPPPGVKPSSNSHDNALFVFRKSPLSKPNVGTWKWRVKW